MTYSTGDSDTGTPRQADRDLKPRRITGKNVIVADHHVEEAERIGRFFESELPEWRTRIVHDASAARLCAAAFRPDVLITDLRLGSEGTAGLELTHSMRAVYPEINVILLTEAFIVQEELYEVRRVAPTVVRPLVLSRLLTFFS